MADEAVPMTVVPRATASWMPTAPTAPCSSRVSPSVPQARDRKLCVASCGEAAALRACVGRNGLLSRLGGEPQKARRGGFRSSRCGRGGTAATRSRPGRLRALPGNVLPSRNNEPLNDYVLRPEVIDRHAFLICIA